MHEMSKPISQENKKLDKVPSGARIPPKSATASF